MLRNVLALVFAVSLTAPAFAQADCEAEANEIWMAVQASDLPQEQQDQVQGHLEAATAEGAAGDEEACLSMIEQLRVALGMDSESQ